MSVLFCFQMKRKRHSVQSPIVQQLIAFLNLGISSYNFRTSRMHKKLCYMSETERHASHLAVITTNLNKTLR